MKRWVGAHAVVPMLLIVLAGALLVRQTGATGTSGAQQDAERVYVLDANNKSREDARVVAVDPAAGRVVTTFATRSPAYQPSFTLSPDGALLYIAYGASVQPNGPTEGFLEVLDTSTGQSLHHTRNADRWLSTLPEFQAYEMSMSADGRWLYLLKMSSSTPGHSDYFVRTFDTVARAFLPTPSHVPMCVSGLLLPSVEDRHRLSVLCSHTQDVRLLTLSDTGAPAAPTASVQVAESATRSHVHVSTAFRSAGGNVTAVGADGAFSKVAESSRRIVMSDLVDRSARQAVNAQNDWFRGRRFRPQSPVVAPDGTLLYLMLDRVSEAAEGTLSSTDVVVLGTERLQRVRSLRFSRPVASIAVSRDGRRLYGVDREGAALLSLDTSTGVELNPIVGVGNLPLFAVVGPRQ